MSRLFATAGSKLFIGAAMAFAGTDLVASDFNSQSWTEVKGTTDLGQIGDTAQIITSSQVGSGRDRKIKGTRNAGQMQVMVDLDYSDPGQLALVAAEKTSNSYAFRLVMNDAPAGGTPSERFFVAFVASAAEQLGQANSATQLQASLEIDSNIALKASTVSGDAPTNSVLPAITGTAAEDETLTASTGTWAGTAPIAYAYQWFSGGESIPGANSSTYVVQADDVGNTITVMVTASNGVGTASAISAATATVTS